MSELEGDEKDSGIDVATSQLPMIVHELRGPMAAIQSAAALLELRLGKLDPIQPGIAPVLERLRRNVGLLDRMTSDLLTVARAQLGPEVIERAPADLVAIIVPIMTDGPWAERAHLVTPFSTLPLNCDAGRMGQIVWNLLRNAAQHGAGGAIQVRLEQWQGGIALTVENEGELPARLRERLFQPFVRGQATGQGLGLGLYLVRRFTEAHGGTVSVDSAAGRVRFRIFLPASS